MALSAELNIHFIAAPSIVIDILSDDSLVICAANSAAKSQFPAENHRVEGMVLTDFEGMNAEKVARRQKTILHLRRCIEGKEPRFSEAQQQRRDGSLHWNRRAYIPIMDASAEVEKVMVMSFDINEIIEPQQELKFVINSIGAPIFIVDVRPGNRFFWRFFNPSAEKFYDLQSDKFEGGEIGDFENIAEYRIAFRKRLLVRCESLVLAKNP
ncbi:MAG: PAS domain-containing protein [Candidatus Azotimanducaceae bacterium]|jgi:PAS domain-containing protein